ncbi:MAG TPA: hypothetical protein VF271_06695 [Rhodanobacteraceae bacterium]
MTWLKNILKRTLHLFVGDAWLAGATLVWLAIVWLCAATVLPPVWRGLILFAGLAGIVLVSAWRHTRQR